MNEKNYFFLKALSTDDVDAIIISETSTADDITAAINQVKNDIPDYQWPDIVNGLPDDCEIISKWDNVENIYY